MLLITGMPYEEQQQSACALQTENGHKALEQSNVRIPFHVCTVAAPGSSSPLWRSSLITADNQHKAPWPLPGVVKLFAFTQKTFTFTKLLAQPCVRQLLALTVNVL